MLGWVRNVFVAFALAYGLVAGTCVTCPRTFATESLPHDCCPHGSKDTHQKPCPAHGVVFESYSKIEAVSPLVKADAAVIAVATPSVFHIPASSSSAEESIVPHPPPGRHPLNSILLL